MPIEVRGPDGISHSFPDGTANDAINAQMLQKYPQYANPLYGGQPGTLRPFQAPQAGTTTPAGGNVMPHSTVQPGYLNQEDYQNLVIGAVIPNASGILQQSPGLERQRAMQREIGKNMAGLEDRQRAGTHMLSLLHDLLGETAFPGGQPHPALGSAIGPVNSSDLFQRGREAVNVGNVLGTQPGYNLHNRLTHSIDALTTGFLAAASRGGIQMSDSRQKAFTDTMGRMMNATNPQEFDHILRDADRFIRETFELQQGRRVDPQPRSTTQPPARQGQTGAPRARARNPQTGAVVEWDGTSWVPVAQ